MTEGAYLVQIIAAVFFLIVGIRLLRLSRRTGEAPEKLLGIYFVLGGLAYGVWQLPEILSNEAIMNPTDLTAWAIYSAGVVPFMLFTRLAFRPTSAWANWLVVSCTLSLFIGTGAWMIQGYGVYAVGSPLYWANWMGYTVPCIWLSVEAFLAYGSASRRVRVKLCDRVVANRYLLFGCFGIFQTLACITDPFMLFQEGVGVATSAGFDGLLGAFEMAAIAMLFFAFFPPAFYERWLSAPAAQSVDG
jgi:hypothetical protein